MSEQLKFSVNSDNTVNVRIKNANGSYSSRLISFQDLTETFRSDDVNMELPLLPRGVRKFKIKGERTLIGIEYPPSRIAKVSWAGEAYEDIPTPGSIWLTLLHNNSDGTYRIIKNHVYGLNGFGLLGETTRFFHWPFPNHSIGYSSGICWGNDENFARMKNSCDLSSLSSLYSMYFAATFNSDLGFHINRPEGCEDTLFKFLAGKERYEDDWLESLEESSNIVRATRNLIGA